MDFSLKVGLQILCLFQFVEITRDPTFKDFSENIRWDDFLCTFQVLYKLYFITIQFETLKFKFNSLSSLYNSFSLFSSLPFLSEHRWLFKFRRLTMKELRQRPNLFSLFSILCHRSHLSILTLRFNPRSISFVNN